MSVREGVVAAPKGNKFAAGNPGGGRPTQFKLEYVRLAKSMCALGATDAELAEAFEVSITTINTWKARHKEFSAALKMGKSEADERVERSLYHKALGYTFDSEKVFQFQGEIVRTKTVEHVPPDTTACIFWLKNRDPENWRDKTEVKHDASEAFANLWQRIGGGTGAAP
jgi:hypothetical protein